MPSVERSFGVSGIRVYLPPYRVKLEDWCGWTGANWDKVRSVVGSSFRLCGPHENAYTMAANAVLDLIVRYGIDPARVGFLGLGTESSTDNSAGAVIVRGMVDRALAKLKLPKLARDVEVPEYKHACLGGVYALKGALRYLACDGEGRQAIIVCSDIAEYERGSSGEQTQGAGAVAMLIEEEPHLFEVDLRHAGSASAYRGPDFRKPFARHFTEHYTNNRQRPNDYPVFSGRYSTFAYLDETAHAVDRMLARLGRNALSFFDSVRALFFHRPYQNMPVQALSFVYVRALAATTASRAELRALCEAAEVSVDDVVAEARSSPDLYASVLTGDADANPYPATNAVAGALRKSETFHRLASAKMGLGSDGMKELGNLYTAALPAWVASGFEEAVQRGDDIAGTTMALIGYGSGDAAEAIPIHPVRGWETAARRIEFAKALDDAVDLTREQYEALHDGRAVDFQRAPRRGFKITGVGDRYDSAFQDLCVEYYDYVA